MAQGGIVAPRASRPSVPCMPGHGSQGQDGHGKRGKDGPAVRMPWGARHSCGIAIPERDPPGLPVRNAVIFTLGTTPGGPCDTRARRPCHNPPAHPSSAGYKHLIDTGGDCFQFWPSFSIGVKNYLDDQ